MVAYTALNSLPYICLSPQQADKFFQTVLSPDPEDLDETIKRAFSLPSPHGVPGSVEESIVLDDVRPLFITAENSVVDCIVHRLDHEPDLNYGVVLDFVHDSLEDHGSVDLTLDDPDLVGIMCASLSDRRLQELCIPYYIIPQDAHCTVTYVKKQVTP
jgi:hypothetical protein